MKLSENLQKLRKQKGLSQEALAEKLGVTRQSVSKWESGASYPEMDKLISMCSIFECSMDYLLNGVEETEIKENKDEKNKFNVNHLVSEITDSVEKTIRMLSNKSCKEVIRFIFEIIVIFFIIMFLKVPVEMLQRVGNNVFFNLGSIGDIFSTLWIIFTELAYLVLALLLFITIFKVRYLDNYEEKEIVIKKEDKVSEIKDDEEVKVTEKNRSKKSGIISLLAYIFTLFIKFIATCILIGFAFETIFAIIAFAFSVILFIDGLHLFGPVIALLGLVIFSIIISQMLFNFIVSHKSNFKQIFISFVISFLLIGFGISMSLYSFSSMTYIDNLPENYEKKIVVEEIEMNEELYFSNYCASDIEFIIDDNLNNVKIEMEGYEKIRVPGINQYDNEIYVHTYFEQINGSQIIKEVVKNLKDGKIYTYETNVIPKTKVISSEKNINTIKNNMKKHCLSETEENSYVNSLQNEINDLEHRNAELYQENESLKDENEILKQKNEELVNKITDALNN